MTRRTFEKPPRPGIPGKAIALLFFLSLFAGLLSAGEKDPLTKIQEDLGTQHLEFFDWSDRKNITGQAVAFFPESNEIAVFRVTRGEPEEVHRKKLKEDVNGAVESFSVEGTRGNWTFTLCRKLAFHSYRVEDTLSWDGRKLKIVKSLSSDSSEIQLKAALEAIAKGDRDRAVDEVGGVMYPMNYLGPHTAAEFLAKGSAEAEKRWKKRDGKGAASVLFATFEAITGMYEVQPAGAAGEEPFEPFKTPIPARWVKVLNSYRIEPGKFLPPLNDLGFFWQAEGRHAEAVGIFRAVLELAPDRVVAYLNLADSLWAEDRKPEALGHYRSYAEMMERTGKKQRVPPRVYDRLETGRGKRK